MVTRTTKRRPETRARLEAAALEAFSELGFHGASIRDICSRAGYTRGAFYSNFASKDELFFALFDAHADRSLARLSALAERRDEPSPTIEQIVEVLAYVSPEERVWYLISTEFTLHAIRVPEAARRLAAYDRKLRLRLSDAIASLLHGVGLTLAVDVDRLARSLVAVREGALAQSYVEPDEIPPGTIERWCVPALIRDATAPAAPR
ncbi:MAG TPA: TetR/AcrR family transcriptional regulator [Baekduia sp.]|nr:TetR/AcrR family transcriptional regulator [Baekduia sp.]